MALHFNEKSIDPIEKKKNRPSPFIPFLKRHREEVKTLNPEELIFDDADGIIPESLYDQPQTKERLLAWIGSLKEHTKAVQDYTILTSAIKRIDKLYTQQLSAHSTELTRPDSVVDPNRKSLTSKVHTDENPAAALSNLRFDLLQSLISLPAQKDLPFAAIDQAIKLVIPSYSSDKTEYTDLRDLKGFGMEDLFSRGIYATFKAGMECSNPNDIRAAINRLEAVIFYEKGDLLRQVQALPKRKKVFIGERSQHFSADVYDPAESGYTQEIEKIQNWIQEEYIDTLEIRYHSLVRTSR